MILYSLVVVSVLSVTLTRSQNTSTTLQLPVVETQLGAISGLILTSKNGRQYEAFRGIPYARPPVGDLRFSKPQPHPPFEQGRFDAGEYGKLCWQDIPGLIKFNGSLMSEDCLFLNIFRPRKGQSSDSIDRPARPVFIFIHGGAFISGGSAFYEPGQLVTEGNVVVVTVNYRLGIFGFLSTGDSRFPGNYGLWDQLLAIRWVKDNIQAFGGDPDQITVGGESAGAVSSAFHSLSSHSKGLFKRAILQSGAATTSGAIQRNPLQGLQDLAGNVHCPRPGSSLPSGDVLSDQDTLTCLKNASPEQLMAAQYPDRSLARAIADYVYMPRVDGDLIASDPAEMLQNQDYLTQIGFYDRDYLSGCVNNEGGYFLSQTKYQTGNERLLLNLDFYDLDLVPLLIEKRYGRSSLFAEEVVKFFYTFPRYPGTTQLNLKAVLDTPGDTFFYVPLTEFARAVARGQRSERRNLVYFFEHYPAYLVERELGTPHAADLLYEFDMDPSFFGNASLWNADDDHLRQVFIGMIVGFMETGNPSTAFQAYLKDGWSDFDLHSESYLSIKPETLTMQRHLRAHGVSLWVDLLPSLLDPVVLRGNHSSTHIPTLSELIG